MTLSRRRAWAIVFVATLTTSVSYLDRQTLSVLAPVVSKALGLSETDYGWLAAAFSISYLVACPIAGRLVDRVGSPRSLFGAVLLWSIVAALHAIVPGFAVLFGLRIALGFAEAPSFSGAAQAIHRVLPPEDRARGMGLLFTGSSIGAMIAPPLATAFAARFGWRGSFLGTALCGLAWLPLWRILAFEARARVALESGREDSGREQAPAMISIITHREVVRAFMLVLASAPSVAFILLWASKYLVRQHGIQQLDVGGYLWLPPLMFDLGAISLSELSVRRKRTRGTKRDRGLILLAALLQSSIVLMAFAPDPWTAMLAAGVSMAGGGGLFALLTTEMLSRVPAAAISLAGGVAASAQSLAYVIANPSIGASVDRYASFTPALLVLGVLIIPGVLFWILLPDDS